MADFVPATKKRLHNFLGHSGSCGWSAQVGIATSLKQLREDVSQQHLEGLVRHLCDQKDVDGLLVQLPLPPHLNEEAVIDTFNPSKDVDGFHPVNVGCASLHCSASFKLNSLHPTCTSK